jgi:hypothetical protein
MSEIKKKPLNKLELKMYVKVFVKKDVLLVVMMLSEL